MPFGNPLGYLLGQSMGGLDDDPYQAALKRQQMAMGNRQFSMPDEELAAALQLQQPAPPVKRTMEFRNGRDDQMIRGPVPLPNASMAEQPGMMQLASDDRFATPRSAARAGLAARNIEQMGRMADPAAGLAEAKSYAQQRIQESGRFNGMAPRGINPHSGAPSPASLNRHLAAGPGLGAGPSGSAPTANPLAGMSFEEWAAAKAQGVDPNPQGGLSSVRGLSRQHPAMVARAERQQKAMDNRREFLGNQRGEAIAQAGEGGVGQMGNLLSPQALSFIPPNQRAQYVGSVLSVINSSLQRGLDREHELKTIKEQALADGDVEKAKQAAALQLAQENNNAAMQRTLVEVDQQKQALESERMNQERRFGLEERGVVAQEKQADFLMSPEGQRGAAFVNAPERSPEEINRFYGNSQGAGGGGASIPDPNATQMDPQARISYAEQLTPEQIASVPIEHLPSLEETIAQLDRYRGVGMWDNSQEHSIRTKKYHIYEKIARRHGIDPEPQEKVGFLNSPLWYGPDYGTNWQ